MKRTIAILTGASRGVGMCIAREMLRRKVALVTIARNENDELAEHARQAGARLTQVRCDLSDLSATDAAANRVAALITPGFDRYLLINNAATVCPISTGSGLIHSAPISRALNLNLVAAVTLTGHFLNIVQGIDADRRILNISSGAGRSPVAGWAVYCASKAALDMYTRVIRLEQSSRGVRIASLAPGIIDTDMQATIRASDADSFPSVATFQELKNAGKLCMPDAVAIRILAYLDDDAFGDVEIDDIRRFN